ncbi:zinc finger protein ZAT4 [Raphanus sativus]|uniref:Zinc finger protein ZAT4 n=1 Tax=Raphanus sativus TaxID=3726 RepID=A0A6J0L6I6_RAPSA|nr:zinc finger protein ZAT4 [Raphanus sativus]
MDQLRGYKPNCRFSLGRPRFGSIKFKVPNSSSQPFISEQRRQIEEEDQEEARSIGFREEDEDDGAKSIDLEGEEKKHVCCECGKRFKSGKALGGHKRIHVVETRKFSTARPKMVSSGAVAVGRSETTERDDFEVDCCVCHKKFTSMKALYGHMRFHPDRGWKGVLPPHHPLGDDHDGEFITSDYDNDDGDYDYHEDDDENSELWDNHWGLDNVVDLKDSIKEGWAVTGKRGRRSALKDPPSEDVDAKDLLFLATTAEAVDLDAAETCDSRSVEEMMKRRRKKKKRLSEMEKESSSSHDHHHQLEVGGAAGEGGGAREKHVCVTCNKSFASYQALGGHRASHNKVKISEMNHQARANGEALLLGTEAMITGLASAQGPNTSLSISNKGDHVCNICQRSFSTGQALGGHKRCHWPGPASNEAATAPGPVSSEAATAAPTAPEAGSSSQVVETVQEEKKLKRKFLEFDLNELPPNEE